MIRIVIFGFSGLDSSYHCFPGSLFWSKKLVLTVFRDRAVRKFYLNTGNVCAHSKYLHTQMVKVINYNKINNK